MCNDKDVYSSGLKSELLSACRSVKSLGFFIQCLRRMVDEQNMKLGKCSRIAATDGEISRKRTHKSNHRIRTSNTNYKVAGKLRDYVSFKDTIITRSMHRSALLTEVNA